MIALKGRVTRLVALWGSFIRGQTGYANWNSSVKWAACRAAIGTANHGSTVVDVGHCLVPCRAGRQPNSKDESVGE